MDQDKVEESIETSRKKQAVAALVGVVWVRKDCYEKWAQLRSLASALGSMCQQNIFQSLATTCDPHLPFVDFFVFHLPPFNLLN